MSVMLLFVVKFQPPLKCGTGSVLHSWVWYICWLCYSGGKWRGSL